MGGELKKSTRTKIIATIGPSVDSYDAVVKLINAGASAIRLNFSHGTHKEREKQIAWIKKAAKAAGRPIAIIGDLQGPKLRLGDFDDMVNIIKGRVVSFKFESDYTEDGHVPLAHDISSYVKRGDRLLVNDGRLHLKIQASKNGVVYAAAENNGILIRRKGVSLPDTDFAGEVITTKDRKDLAFCSEQGIDFIAQSFIQNAGDVAQLKRLLKNLGSQAKLIAKIETRSAAESLVDITSEADAVMVARGDLAVETSPEEVPIIQRQIIELCKSQAKPSIVATQLLASMVTEIQPTRAEVSDLSTAVLLGTDAVMLSDETASGEHPIEAVETASRVLRYAENHSQNYPKTLVGVKTQQSAICEAVINLADHVSATAIVAETKSGATANLIAARRPSLPLLAVTSSNWVANQLSISYGVSSYLRPDDKLAAKKLTYWLRLKKILKKGDIVVTCSGQHPGVVGATDTIKVRMLE